jgi:DUF4097 and DUF4098 domain-containing protein YvlB
MERWVVADELATDLEPVTNVTVRIVAGDVTITSGETSHVQIKRLSGADVHAEFRDGGLLVAQPDPDIAPIERFIKMFTEGSRHRCSVAITAAPGSRIAVTTVSAEVVASGFDGGTNVKTVSGEVTLSRMGKDLDVKTVSGDISAKDVSGGLKLKTVSGDIAIVDGSCGWIDAKGVSGDVLLDLDLDPSGTYDVSTVSGDVAVRTVSEPNLFVEASSVSGRFSSDFGIAWHEKPGRKHLSETIGSGGARLWMKTVSGNLRVLRGRQSVV